MTAYKSLYMNSTLYSRLAVLAIAGILAACSSASPDDDKKSRLEKLKTQQADIAKEIKQLEAEIAKEDPTAAKKGRAKEVDIVSIAPRPFDFYVTTQGMIESDNNILITAKAAGTITKVFVSEGQSVNQGQVLAQIDNSAIVSSIEAQQAQLSLLTAVYERQKRLWDQKIGTEVQFLSAKSNKEAMEKTIASLKEQNDNYFIKSPISGVVDDLMIKQGENAGPGVPAARVVNNSDLKLKAKISEAYTSQIQKGNRVLVSAPALGKDVEAKVTFVGKTIDPMSRTFAIEVALPNRPELRPNMSATVKVIFQTSAQALVIPVNIIQDINDEKVVYIAEQDGSRTVAKRKVVTVEGVYGSDAQIKGLNAGDRIITVGYQGLNDGDAVQI